MEWYEKWPHKKDRQENDPIDKIEWVCTEIWDLLIHSEMNTTNTCAILSYIMHRCFQNPNNNISKRLGETEDFFLILKHLLEKDKKKYKNE